VVTPTALAAREWFRIGVLGGRRDDIVPEGVGTDAAPSAPEPQGRDWLRMFRAARTGEPGNDPDRPRRIDAAE